MVFDYLVAGVSRNSNYGDILKNLPGFQWAAFGEYRFEGGSVGIQFKDEGIRFSVEGGRDFLRAFHRDVPEVQARRFSEECPLALSRRFAQIGLF